MGYIDFVSVGSFVGLFLGILMIVIGLYSQRRGRLRYRQGAQVLAGFATIVGASVVVLGLLALLRA
jgi:hypothetical protein